MNYESKMIQKEILNICWGYPNLLYKNEIHDKARVWHTSCIISCQRSRREILENKYEK